MSERDNTSKPSSPDRHSLTQPNLSAGNKPHDIWNLRLEELRRFKELHGDCNVPAKYPPNRKLGHWVMTQRRQYVLMKQKQRSSMTENRVLQLNNLGFSWNPRESKGFSFNRWLSELVEFKEKFGHCNVPSSYPPNPALPSWVNMQRQHYEFFRQGKASNMTQERVRALNEIGFDWRLHLGEVPSMEMASRLKDARVSVQESTGTIFEQATRRAVAPRPVFLGPVNRLSYEIRPHLHDFRDWDSSQHIRSNQVLIPVCTSVRPIASRFSSAPLPQETDVSENASCATGSNFMEQRLVSVCRFCRSSIVGSYYQLHTHESQCARRTPLFGVPATVCTTTDTIEEENCFSQKSLTDFEG